MKKQLFALTLLIAVLLGCSTGEVTPIVNNPAFETFLLRDDLPDEIGHTNLTNDFIQDPVDAMGLAEGVYLLNIGGTVYHYKNDVFTKKIDMARWITKTENGKIYVLGEDAIYTSTDGGDTFTVQDKIISNLGTDFALDVYHNGSPNRIYVQKTPAGEYIMWLVRAYKYNLGGTGFSETRYTNYGFASPDGINWTYKPESWIKQVGYVMGIQQDGAALFILEDDPNVNRSYDFGKTLEPTFSKSKGRGPNTLSPNNNFYYVSSISFNDRFKSGFEQWDGNTWADLNPTIDEKAMSANASQVFALRINYTANSRMILINSHGIYLSDKAF